MEEQPQQHHARAGVEQAKESTSHIDYSNGHSNSNQFMTLSLPHDHFNNSTAAALNNVRRPVTVSLSKEDLKRAALRNKQILQEQAFWKQISKEVSEIDYQTEEFRSQTEIPLRPIKRVMCQEGDVGVNKVMFSAESSILFAKACEVFILELTLRGWANADKDKRRILTKSDIVSRCYESEMYDFLVDIIPPPQKGKSKSKTETKTKTKQLQSHPPPLSVPLPQSQSHPPQVAIFPPDVTASSLSPFTLAQDQHFHHPFQEHRDMHTISQPAIRPIDSQAMAAYYHQIQQQQQQLQQQQQQQQPSPQIETPTPTAPATTTRPQASPPQTQLEPLLPPHPPHQEGLRSLKRKHVQTNSNLDDIVINSSGGGGISSSSSSSSSSESRRDDACSDSGTSSARNNSHMLALQAAAAQVLETEGTSVHSQTD